MTHHADDRQNPFETVTPISDQDLLQRRQALLKMARLGGAGAAAMTVLASRRVMAASSGE